MTQYTREQILSMPVGRELNKLAATEVMGWLMYHYDKDVAENCYYVLVDEEFESVSNALDPECETEEEAWNHCPDFSGDIAAAWELVKILSKKYGVEVYENAGPSSECKLYPRGKTPIHVISATTTEAITKAAILAMMEKSGGTDS
ncbi:hypothetical protein MH117_04955 [Paenibacillus sp. ACRRX]|uniref:BC1872 family protein n=1 Tax=Paenibacillus sp. ACRRX TaxID=2918206 RepID=UPI001EF56EE6|nr:hypothetical protein [Paenibacillus sp. ACRRX]MCG7406759.1 hypothetical protein [Paenibacillus sp. ACRRX]